MKKALIVSALVIAVALVLLIPGSAAGESGKEVRIVVIINEDALRASAENASLFDRVLDAVAGSGRQFAFFFDSKAPHNGDTASALMKAYCANMPMGIYDESGGQDTESVYGMLTFEKYVTKTVSRLLLTGGGAVGRYGGGFSAYSSGLIVPPSFSLSEENLNNYDNVTVSLRISDANIEAVEKFFSSMNEYDISFVTATETGFR